MKEIISKKILAYLIDNPAKLKTTKNIIKQIRPNQGISHKPNCFNLLGIRILVGPKPIKNKVIITKMLYKKINILFSFRKISFSKLSAKPSFI